MVEIADPETLLETADDDMLIELLLESLDEARRLERQLLDLRAEMIDRLRKRGLSMREIAAKLKIDKRRVFDIVHDN